MFNSIHNHNFNLIILTKFMNTMIYNFVWILLNIIINTILFNTIKIQTIIVIMIKLKNYFKNILSMIFKKNIHLNLI
jgi:hypothetical protein